jgi:hypothetical protein
LQSGKPAPVTANDIESLRAWAAGLNSRRLVGVRYWYWPDTEWPNGWSIDGVDEVAMEISFALDNGSTAVIAWAMAGFDQGVGENQGLALRLVARPFKPREGSLVPIEATELPQWAPLIGRKIVDVGAGWHVSDAGHPETVWSVKLTFDNSISVVVALGELERGSLHYLPDYLVVIFDEDLARTYGQPGRTAWGDRVARPSFE